MKIIYSFNKKGFEAEYWTREIMLASYEEAEFIPFNHDSYLDAGLYIRGQLLDNLYFQQNSNLLRLYSDLEKKISETNADVLLVDNCFPYHPEFLRNLKIYKILRTSDGPMTAYDRDFAYLHAYDHVLYHSPAYSRDLGMAEKLAYIGAKNIDFWPLASFDALCDPLKTEYDIINSSRDIDLIFIGALHLNKMPLIAKLKQAFGKRLRLYGLSSFKKNIYMNLKYGYTGWVKPLPFNEYVKLYQRTKIGINIHNRGDYTVGSYRLFDLPANGVMQISDGGNFLNDFFSVGNEIESYRSSDELIDKIKFYLLNDVERNRIALNGYLRVQKDYKIGYQMKNLVSLIHGKIDTKEFIK